MPPELVEMLKRLFNIPPTLPPVVVNEKPPDTVDPRLAGLLASPFVQDTLKQIIGTTNARFNSVTPLESPELNKLYNNYGVNAFVDLHQPNKVNVFPEGESPQTISHELVHILQSTKSPQLEKIFAGVFPAKRGQNAPGNRNMEEREGYTLQNAIYWLRIYGDPEKAKDPYFQDLARQDLSVLESQDPGTGQVIRNLFDMEPYSGHPLKGVVDKYLPKSISASQTGDSLHSRTASPSPQSQER